MNIDAVSTARRSFVCTLYMLNIILIFVYFHCICAVSPSSASQSLPLLSDLSFPHSLSMSLYTIFSPHAHLMEIAVATVRGLSWPLVLLLLSWPYGGRTHVRSTPLFPFRHKVSLFFSSLCFRRSSCFLAQLSGKRMFPPRI